MWETTSTEEFDDWIESLDEKDEDRDRVRRSLGRERTRIGSASGRPGREFSPSEYEGAQAGHDADLVRIDPERRGVLLIGGDKRDEWDTWYEEWIPVADDLFDAHLRRVAEES